MGATATFNALVGDLDYPMFIVTACAGGERAGCLVGFATQTSIDPSRFLVCLSRNNHTYRVARRARTLAVHWVPADAAGLAELFGGETGDAVDKFARVAWHPGPGDVPIIEDCPNWFAGRIVERVGAGDHDAFLLEPIAAHQGARGEEFTFHRARRIAPGHPA
jgi:flavin reductase (DIM6/NTAB) family NADH-FMN oxidoreductase RutF